MKIQEPFELCLTVVEFHRVSMNTNYMGNIDILLLISTNTTMKERNHF